MSSLTVKERQQFKTFRTFALKRRLEAEEMPLYFFCHQITYGIVTVQHFFALQVRFLTFVLLL